MNQQIGDVIMSVLCFAKRVVNKGLVKEVSSYLDSVCFHVEQLNKSIRFMESVKDGDNNAMLKYICDRAEVLLPLGELVFMNFISISIVRCCECDNNSDVEMIISNLLYIRLDDKIDSVANDSHAGAWHEEEINVQAILDKNNSVVH